MHSPSCNLSYNFTCCLFSKGDAKHEVIDEFITIADNEKLPFTFQRYCDYYKATRPRLFLLKRKKSHFQRNREMIVADISDDNETDEDDSGIEFISISGNHTGDTILPTASSTATATPLIDTSEERVLLRDEITRVFNESLELDMEKNNKNREQEHIKEWQMQLMQQRKARVKEQVSYADPHVMVTVRYITFNCDKSRALKDGANMVEVHDWIRSLSPIPEYFEIVHYKGSLVPPDMEAPNGI